MIIGSDHATVAWCASWERRALVGVRPNVSIKKQTDAASVADTMWASEAAMKALRGYSPLLKQAIGHTVRSFPDTALSDINRFIYRTRTFFSNLYTNVKSLKQITVTIHVKIVHQ